MRLVIGFMGKSGTGKTTLANFIKNIFCESGAAKTRVLSFATPIKEALQMVDDPLSFRKAAQSLGDSFTKEDPNYLVNKAKETMDADKDLEVAIFDDIRRIQEVDFIQSYDTGLIFYLRVPEQDRLDRLYKRDGKYPDESIKEHATENLSPMNVKPLIILHNIDLDDSKLSLEFMLRMTLGHLFPEISILSNMEYLE